jgi:SAM-dependent methyltransferase
VTNAPSSRRLALHEAQALLGVGDLHPGCAAATEFLLGELDKITPRRVLEVGTGIGRTTERMLARGWQVTAIEPNAVMRRVLERRLAIRAWPGGFETFSDPGSYDALIAESVFYRFDLAQAFAHAYRLIRPGGMLALVDMIWTDAAQPEAVPAIAAETGRAFGIPATSAEPLTWQGWEQRLLAAGFAEVAARRIGPGTPEPGRRRRILLNGLRHPVALAHYLSYRKVTRRSMVPDDWLESWMSVWRRE